MKILVLGGTQFVSWYIVKRLIEEGNEVTTITRGNKKGVHGSKVEEVYLDRHNELELKNALKEKEFEYVIDISAYTLSDVEKIYESLSGKDIKGYIFISSSAVYKESEELPIKEYFPKGENKYWGNYGTNKLEAENFLISKWTNNKFPAIILRPPYIYGEGNNVYREGYIFDRIKEGKNIIIPNRCETIVQFIHIEDLYKTIKKIIKDKIVGKIYNVGNEKGITLKEWVEKCMLAYGEKVEIIEFDCEENNYNSRDFFPFFDYQYCLDVTEICKIYKPEISMEIGLKRAINWYFDNEEKVMKRSHYSENSDKIIENLK